MEKDGIKINSRFLDDEGKYLLIELGGYVDQANCHHLQHEINEALKADIVNIIFDLKDLTYMSSAGWGILVGEIKRFREKGGDIKLANMPLNIYEVYQMLEFYHILQDYPTVQDAYNSFTGKKYAARKTESATLNNQEKPVETALKVESEDAQINEDKHEEELVDKFSLELEDILQETTEVTAGKEQSLKRVEFIPISIEETADTANLPLAEKVKRVIAKRPFANIFQIRRILRHEEFGNTKISILRLWFLLKELDLDTREKRYRFYRSC